MNVTKQEYDEMKRELRETRKEMKERGIKRTSCFNGGLSGEEYRYNSRLFALKTKLDSAVIAPDYRFGKMDANCER